MSPWGERWDYRGYQGNIYDERYAGLGRRDAGSTLDPTFNRMYESRLYRWRARRLHHIRRLFDEPMCSGKARYHVGRSGWT